MNSRCYINSKHSIDSDSTYPLVHTITSAYVYIVQISCDADCRHLLHTYVRMYILGHTMYISTTTHTRVPPLPSPLQPLKLIPQLSLCTNPLPPLNQLQALNHCVNMSLPPAKNCISAILHSLQDTTTTTCSCNVVGTRATLDVLSSEHPGQLPPQTLPECVTSTRSAGTRFSASTTTFSSSASGHGLRGQSTCRPRVSAATRVPPYVPTYLCTYVRTY